MIDTGVLLLAGLVAGIVSTVVSLASIVSYPVLLAVGIPPLGANMTNTVALTFTGLGSFAGSRRELRDHGTLLLRLGWLAVLGGAVGAGLLLVTPSDTFQVIAPWLIGGASLALLFQPALQRIRRGTADHRSAPLQCALLAVAGYVGFFGAAGGILMMAVLGSMLDLPVAEVNALKNAMSALANCVAALAFAVFGAVHWLAALPLAAGFLVGGYIGPSLARRMPGQSLRIVAGLCGVAVAVKLSISGGI